MHIVIVTHGELANGLVDSVRLIMGEQENIWTFTLTHEMSIEDFGQRLQNQILSLCENDSVLVFTDLLLASPYNQAITCYKHLSDTNRLRVLTGVSLPMVLEAASLRLGDDSLENIAKSVTQVGKDGITDFLISLEEKQIDINAL